MGGIEISMGGCAATPLARCRRIWVREFSPSKIGNFPRLKFGIRDKTGSGFYLWLSLANNIKNVVPDIKKAAVKDTIKITSFGLSVGSYIVCLFVCYCSY